MLEIPIFQSEFYAEFFEKKHFHIRNVAESGVFTLDDLDDLMLTLDPGNYEDVKVVLGGRVPIGEYASTYQDLNDIRQRIMPAKLKTLLRAGATLVINRLDLKNRKIASICQHISDLYQLKTVANGYLALGGEGAFGKHWDTHDVFALQLFGRKRWRIFGPTFRLPLEHQTSFGVKDTCPEATVFDGVLEAGDVLYIPRGWWHEATPLANDVTFHLAIGAHTAKLLDYLAWVAEHFLPQQNLARTSITHQSMHAASISQFARLITETLSDPEVYSRFLDEIEELRNSYTPFGLELMMSPSAFDRLTKATNYETSF